VSGGVSLPAQARWPDVSALASDDGAVGRAVLDGLPEVVQVNDALWRWVYLNPAAQRRMRALGHDPALLIGGCVWEVVPATTPPATRAAALLAAREQREIVVETSERVLDQERAYQMRIVPIAGGYVSLTRDVTETARAAGDLRRRSELVDHTTHCLGMVDARSDRVMLANPALARLLGYEPGELQGMPVHAIYTAPARVGLLAVVRTAHERGRVAFDTTCLHRDGTALPVHVELTTVYHADGTPHYRVVDVEDVRELTHLADAERAARAEAEAARGVAAAANRARSDFLTVMSHELRTPLNGIAGYTELLQMGLFGPVTDAQRENLERIRRSEQQLLALINDLLNFARLVSGRVEYALAPTPVAMLVQDVVEIVAPQAAGKGLLLAVQPVAPCVVRVDAERARQVLLNLLSNAVRFTLSGGRIDIEVEEDAAAVRIHVHDTGPGIAAQQLERIFEPFVQLGRSLSSPRDGSGLGLAISRDLARGMGGDLVARSVVGEGSTFTFTMPRHGAE
jgi:PAS domain S-box-containing protein